jgi:hypothetical protein
MQTCFKEYKMNQDKIEAIQNKVKSYWFSDGLWDMGFGIALLILGLFNVFLSALKLDDSSGWLLGVLEILVVLLPFLLLGKVVNYFKERITYPRTGFVLYRRQTTSHRLLRMLRAALTSFIFASVFAFITLLPVMRERLPAFCGLVLGLVTVFMGWRFRVTRYYLIGFLTLILGVVVSMVVFSTSQSVGLFFSAYGGLWLTGGALTLATYLRHTHPLGENADEGREAQP